MSTQTQWRETIAGVRDIVATVLDIDPARLSRRTSFVDDLGIGAKQSATLRRAIEQRFGVDLSKADAKQLTTVGDLTRYVESHRAAT